MRAVPLEAASATAETHEVATIEALAVSVVTRLGAAPLPFLAHGPAALVLVCRGPRPSLPVP